ncbi:MAG: F0F1 ATP synthase subunit B [Sphingobacteriaceae bacterium]
MQINWFTVIAQVINFLVLVWLMKKYLYKPILEAVDKREKKIAADLAVAQNKMTEAKKEQAEFQKKSEVFDRRKKKMMDQAIAEAEDERQKLLDAAKKEAETIKQKMADASIALQKDLNNQLAKKTQQHVLTIAKKALADLASTTLEKQSVQVFISKIKSLTGKDKAQFINAFHSDADPVSVKSAFELSATEQKHIQTAISALLGNDNAYAFNTDPKLIGGLELSTKGYKLAWSFSAYIDSLEKSMELAMSENEDVAK